MGVAVRVDVGVKVRVAVAVLVGVGVLVAPEPHGLTRVTSAQPDEKPAIELLPLTVHDAGQLEKQGVELRLAAGRGGVGRQGWSVLEVIDRVNESAGAEGMRGHRPVSAGEATPIVAAFDRRCERPGQGCRPRGRETPGRWNTRSEPGRPIVTCPRGLLSSHHRSVLSSRRAGRMPRSRSEARRMFGGLTTGFTTYNGALDL